MRVRWITMHFGKRGEERGGYRCAIRVLTPGLARAAGEASITGLLPLEFGLALLGEGARALAGVLRLLGDEHRLLREVEG